MSRDDGTWPQYGWDPGEYPLGDPDPWLPVRPSAEPEPEPLAERFLPPRWLLTTAAILTLLTAESFLAVLMIVLVRLTWLVTS